MTRVLVTRRGCEACLEYLRFLPAMNLRLPLEKQIRIIDNFEWEEFYIKRHLIQDKFDRGDFDDYPILYLDGALIRKALWAEQLKKFLEKYLSKDFLI